MAALTRWFQSALDRLERPLVLLAVAAFLLVLQRAERQRSPRVDLPVRGRLTLPGMPSRRSS